MRRLFISVALLLLLLLLDRCSALFKKEAEPARTERQPAVVATEKAVASFSAGVVTLSFDVTLTPPAKSDVSVAYRLVAGNDSEVPARGTLTFVPGEQRKSIQLSYNTQTAREITLLLQAGNGVTLADAAGIRLLPADITPSPAAPRPPLPSHRINVSATPPELGRVSGGGRYEKGRVVTLRARPAAGSEFVEWREGAQVISSNQRLNIRVKRSRSLTAYFRPQPPSVTISDLQVPEGNGSTPPLVFTVKLSAPSESDITLDYVTRDGSALGGAACDGVADFIHSSGTLTIGRGSVQASIQIPLCGDSEVEADETFAVTLSNVSADAVLSLSQAVATLANDDVEGAFAYVEAPAEPAADEFDGALRYIKLDAGGRPLVDQAADYTTLPWSCLLDRTTGLVWEVKSDDGGLHDRDWTYTWYHSADAGNGGNAGISGKGFCEESVAAGCDTEKFTQAVNATALCGASDWRLPTLEELQSLVELERINPSLDSAYFPNTRPSWYWSSSPVATDPHHAWLIGFYYGYDLWGRKGHDFYVRLVRRPRAASRPLQGGGAGS